MLPGIGFFGHFIEPNGGFDGFLLGKKQFFGGVPFGIVEPEAQQFFGDSGGIGVVFRSPQSKFLAAEINEVGIVLFDILVPLENFFLSGLSGRNHRSICLKYSASIANTGIVQTALAIGVVV